jgi:hypothetical protein
MVALFMAALRDFCDRPAKQRASRQSGKSRTEGAA